MGDGEREALWCLRRCLVGAMGRSEEGSEFRLRLLLGTTSPSLFVSLRSGFSFSSSSELV